jgi:hypothetical protein
MPSREKQVAEQIDRYFAKSWSLSELAAIMEPISFRTITSWISGQTLKIRPRVWTPEELRAMGCTTVVEKPAKIRKRAKYGFPNLWQCVIAKTLFNSGVSRDIAQHLLDVVAGGTADRQTTLQFGYFLILTAAEPQEGYFFPDRGSLIQAITANPARLPQCAIFDAGAAFKEAMDRLEAWESRSPYVPKLQESILSEAKEKWIAAGTQNLVAAISRRAKKS